jgi:hypothetical protein
MIYVAGQMQHIYVMMYHVVCLWENVKYIYSSAFQALKIKCCVL